MQKNKKKLIIKNVFISLGTLSILAIAFIFLANINNIANSLGTIFNVKPTSLEAAENDMEAEFVINETESVANYVYENTTDDLTAETDINTNEMPVSDDYDEFSDTLSESDINTVMVDNVYDFVNALASNTKIILAPGIYNISDIEHSGGELALYGINNLTIEGSTEGTTEIRTRNLFAYVLKFMDSRNITVNNITAGHENPNTGEYECEAGVFSFEDSQDIYINHCDLYGCGSLGISFYRCNNAYCNNTIIRECSLRAADIFFSTNINFSECIMKDHSAYSNIIFIVGSNTVNFDYCVISNNHKFYWALIEISESNNISFNKCNITNNSNAVPPYEGEDVKVGMFSIDGASSNIMLSNSKIENNKCDFFTYNTNDIILINNDFENNIMPDFSDNPEEFYEDSIE